MNHLRALIDDLVGYKVMVPSGVLESHETHDWFVKEIVRDAEKAVCFFSELDSISGMKPIPSLCKKLPFETCWFEFSFEHDGNSVVFGILAKDYPDGRLGLTVFRKETVQWLLIGNMYSDGKEQRGEIADSIGEFRAAWMADIFSLVRTFVTAMGCNNVRKVEGRPPEKVQKKRQKNGKKPLFSFWTLELKQERVEGDPQGGTHASPRLHLRRGHPREFAPGKYTWVQPCVVGNKKLGMVHKDYALAQ